MIDKAILFFKKMIFADFKGRVREKERTQRVGDVHMLI